MKAIETHNLSFSYGNRPNVIQSVDLSCDTGTVNVLIGLNGSGKTTLIRLLTGLEKSNAGAVSYFEKPLEDMEYRKRSEIYAYVAQNTAPLGDYTVIDYLLFSTSNSLDFYELPGDEHIDRACRQMVELGISDLQDKRLGELSGGQRQMVSICSAMVQDSRVIVLDEPCSALDIVNQNKVLTTLGRIAKDSGKTVLFSTHNPNHALRLDANVLLMKSGRIIDSGLASDVIAPDRLRPVYGEMVCFADQLPYREISFMTDRRCL